MREDHRIRHSGAAKRIGQSDQVGMVTDHGIVHRAGNLDFEVDELGQFARVIIRGQSRRGCSKV